MILNKIINKFIPTCIIKLQKTLRSTTYNIVKKPEDVFEIVYKIKDPSWENTYYPECYGHCKEQHLEVFAPAEYIFKSNDGIVSMDSDVVITDKGVYWQKYNEDEFVSFAEPCDVNVSKFNRDFISIIRYKKQEFIQGRTISLLGVWSYHWVHCMFQYLHKLFSAGEADLLNTHITILITGNEDATIMDMIINYLKKFPKTKIKFAEKNVDYVCQELYFLPSAGSDYNNCKYRLDYKCYISGHVMRQIKLYVRDPLIDKIKNNKAKYGKIFLTRSLNFAKNGRTLDNYEEVHSYFNSIGFVDIEGGKLSLEEKADIFYHAKEVVGLYGSAFVNLIFSNQARCMSLINYRMSTDASVYLLIKDYVGCFVNVTGEDDSAEYHSNYYIPLNKIKRAYSEYIKLSNI